MDLDMDLDMDLSGTSPLATVRSAGACLGPVWDFPAGYGAISWDLSGTCLGPNADLANGFPQLIVRINILYILVSPTVSLNL